MVTRARLAFAPILPVLLTACLLTAAGCASSSLQRARTQFYGGQFESAAQELTESDTTRRDEVLFLMERGMVWQSAGQHNRAIEDWLDAQERIQELDYIRVSEKATSLVINDTTQTYSGRPFERALLHAFTAKSFFALRRWRSAAVEARRLTDGLRDLNGFPDDPYAHYVAAVAFELIRDYSGARIEYTKANELTPMLTIDPVHGTIIPGTNGPPAAATKQPNPEIIGFIGLGRAPAFGRSLPGSNGRWGAKPYIELHANGQSIGRSYTLNTVYALSAKTQRRIAAIQAAKTVTRVVIKDSIADAVADDNPLMGEILRLILFLTEIPDTRAWETLPNWLQVIRAPLPEHTQNLEVVCKSSRDTIIRRIPLQQPLPQTDNKRIFHIRVY